MTNTKKSKPPLWLAMFDAFVKAPDEQRLVIAAELRALVDWLIPEETEPPVGDSEPWPAAYQARSDAMWEQRQLLRHTIISEAARAEKGE